MKLSIICTVFVCSVLVQDVVVCAWTATGQNDITGYSYNHKKYTIKTTFSHSMGIQEKKKDRVLSEMISSGLGMIPKLGEQGVESIKQLGSNVQNGLSSLQQSIVQLIQTLTKKTKEAVSSITTSGMEMGKQMVDTASNSVQYGLESIKSLLQKLIEFMKSLFKM
uniref:Uncharacterized protein n=1 Tax=Rhodnius prolixus TaxID=13249 RepID=T1HDN1_RHOPR